MRLKLYDYETATGKLAQYRQLKKGEYIFVPGANGAMAAIVFGCGEVKGVGLDNEEVEYILTPHATFGPGAFYFCLDIAIPEHRRTVKLAFDYRAHKENLFGLIECQAMFLTAARRPDEIRNNGLMPVNKITRLFKKGVLTVEIPYFRESILNVIRPLAVTHELIFPLTAEIGMFH